MVLEEPMRNETVPIGPITPLEGLITSSGKEETPERQSRACAALSARFVIV